MFNAPCGVRSPGSERGGAPGAEGLRYVLEIVTNDFALSSQEEGRKYIFLFYFIFYCS